MAKIQPTPEAEGQLLGNGLAYLQCKDYPNVLFITMYFRTYSCTCKSLPNGNGSFFLFLLIRHEIFTCYPFANSRVCASGGV